MRPDASALPRLLLVLAVLGGCPTRPAPSPAAPDPRLRIAITVGADGYHPAEARAPAGPAVRLVFTRTTDAGCGQQLVFPTLKLQRDLPLGEPVTIDLTMPKSGRIAFTCGMAMYRGAVVAE